MSNAASNAQANVFDATDVVNGSGNAQQALGLPHKANELYPERTPASEQRTGLNEQSESVTREASTSASSDGDDGDDSGIKKSGSAITSFFRRFRAKGRPEERAAAKPYDPKKKSKTSSQSTAAGATQQRKPSMIQPNSGNKPGASTPSTTRK